MARRRPATCSKLDGSSRSPAPRQFRPAILQQARADGTPPTFVVAPDLYERPGTPYSDQRPARIGRTMMSALPGWSRRGRDRRRPWRDLAWQPDLLHANDWPAALAPAYLAWRGVDYPGHSDDPQSRLSGSLRSPDRLAALGIPDSAFAIDGVEFYGKLSFLKAGLFYATHVTTVSPTYARRSRTPASAAGCDGLLRMRAAEGRLTGIVNGIG